MIQSLISSTTVAVAAAVPISHKINAAPPPPPLPTLSYHKIVASHSDGPQHCRPVQRRAATLGLAGLVLGFIQVGSDRRANAAGKRAPPPPPEEKKDPSINAVTAKVLASKKRKEAMKESIAKLKEKGKLIDQPSP
ncbi:hypothetical protein ACET3Z_005409 [Daucus carota]